MRRCACTAELQGERISPAGGRSGDRCCDLRAHPYFKRAVEYGVDSGVDGVMRLVGWAKRKVAERKCPAELAEVDKTAEVVRQKALVPFSAMRDDTVL